MTNNERLIQSFIQTEIKLAQESKIRAQLLNEQIKINELNHILEPEKFYSGKN